jgi:hypothetical protein
VNLDWNKVGVIIAKKGTSEDRMKYLVLKLKRFEGLDDDESRRDEKGCQGYKDGKGGHYECPFQEWGVTIINTNELNLFHHPFLLQLGNHPSDHISSTPAPL